VTPPIVLPISTGTTKRPTTDPAAIASIAELGVEPDRITAVRPFDLDRDTHPAM